MGIFNKLFGSTEHTSTDLGEVISGGAFLVDVRSRAEFETGSAKGATNIPLDTILQYVDLLKGKEHIVVFCRSGNRSEEAKRILNQKGFRNVINGGTWQQVNQFIKKN